MLFGAHVSQQRIDTAIDRIEKIGGDCVQCSRRAAHVASDEPQAGGDRTLQARRDEVGIRGVVCHALYLCNLAAVNDEVYDKSSRPCAHRRLACAIERTRDLPRRLAPRRRFDAGVARVAAALDQILERCSGDTWLLMENSAGAGARSALARRARDARRRARQPSRSALSRLLHLYVSGVDVTTLPWSTPRREIETTVGSTACARCT